MRIALLCILLVAACRPSTTPTATVAVPNDWYYRNTDLEASGSAAVAAETRLASLAGVEILKAGGNAVDAATATAFALAVTYPEAGNIGGGGFTLVRMADGRTAAIDYREVAPLAATRTMFLDDSGRVTNKSNVGPLASGVPGSVAGVLAAHERFGVLPRARVMQPAITMAEEGIVVDSQLARSFDNNQRSIARFAGAAKFLPDGKPIPLGARLRQPELARTLRAIADSGAAAFYTGALSRAIAEDMRAQGLLITGEDLARYKAEIREPLRSTYRGHTVMTMPPPSSGMTVIETLNILEGWATLPPYESARYKHLLASAHQRAFVDRNRYLADPAFATVPVALVIDKSRAALLRSTIRERAQPTTSVGEAMREGTETTAYSVVDDAGNAVSATTTINSLFGSGVYLPSVGFFMNDEMDDFATNPDASGPNVLNQGSHNAIVPGKRMASSMAPTIILDRQGRPLLLVGGRGGPRIITALTQTIVNVIDHRMGIADAINAPRIHHQGVPDTIRYERRGFAESTLDSLRAMGWAVGPYGRSPELPGNIGSINGMLRRGTRWTAYSDPRSGARAAAR
jgi:gamma-glutamyltranspeptidase/glutathione hydrolase